MKAIQVIAPGEIRIVESERPGNGDLGASEVLVRTKAAGICGSDMHIYHGTSPFVKYPRVIGHEVVGEVVATGGAVADLRAGDRVVLEPIEYCGACYACRIGRPNICEKLVVRGVMKDGGFQEYFTAQADKLHKFPASLDWDEAVLIEPFTIGAQACFRAGVLPGDLVLVLGAGPTGLAVLENAKRKGATCVVADLNPTRLAFAKDFGADHVVNPEAQDLAREVGRISGGMMANVTVDAVGSPSTLETCLELTSVAARVVCMGFTDTFAQVSLNAITKKELTLVGSRLQTFQFPGCIEAFCASRPRLAGLVTHRFPFTEITAAIDLIENRPQEVGKIILQFNR
jgi:L-gulonate 5-dehydrogenase